MRSLRCSASCSSSRSPPLVSCKLLLQFNFARSRGKCICICMISPTGRRERLPAMDEGNVRFCSVLFCSVLDNKGKVAGYSFIQARRGEARRGEPGRRRRKTGSGVGRASKERKVRRNQRRGRLVVVWMVNSSTPLHSTPLHHQRRVEPSPAQPTPIPV